MQTLANEVKSLEYFGQSCYALLPISCMFPSFHLPGNEQCNRCWNKPLTQDTSFNDGLLRNEIDNEKTCKSLCYNNETCVGAYWGFKSSLNKVTCWFQMSSQGVSGTLLKANHWILSNCTGTIIMLSLLGIKLPLLMQQNKSICNFLAFIVMG